MDAVVVELLFVVVPWTQELMVCHATSSLSLRRSFENKPGCQTPCFC
jgi:hypothetical protein